MSLSTLIFEKSLTHPSLSRPIMLSIGFLLIVMGTVWMQILKQQQLDLMNKFTAACKSTPVKSTEKFGGLTKEEVSLSKNRFPNGVYSFSKNSGIQIVQICNHTIF